ncbi:MAG TPA: regulatory protein RecX [Dermatophilaceae bacterium]|nr:regulatory protein RecX [Dermatophilaceae bacterium]
MPPPPDPAAQDGEPDPHEVARQIALRQLALSPRSRAQLSRKLRDRGCDPVVADAVLDRMAEVGLVDDQAYAELLVRSQQAARGLAKGALAQQLRAKGIEEDLVRDTVGAIAEETERDQAHRLVAKKLRTMHGVDASVQARRLGAMLARKGYPSGLSWSVVQEALAGAPEHQRD